MSKSEIRYELLRYCRSCSSSDLEECVDLGNMFSSGHFPRLLDEPIPIGRLRLLQCKSCFLVQLDRNFKLETLFGTNYGYRTALNDSMKTHVESVAVQAMSYFEDYPKVKVLDIGSNDGTLLNYFISLKNCVAVGVDPNVEDMRSHYAETIHTYSNFFDSEFVSTLARDFGVEFDIITSIAMFYDVQDPNQFLKSIKYLLADDGIWVVEVSYLFSMLTSRSVDAICHEHVTYYSIKSMSELLSRNELKVVDFEFNEANGGSMRLIVQHSKSRRPKSMEFCHQKQLEEEKPQMISKALKVIFQEIGCDVQVFLKHFGAEIDEGRIQLLGIGASTKGNTFLQLFPELSSKILAIGEVNSDKFGRFTPGTLIPIVDQSELIQRKGRLYLVVLPWHFKRGIVETLGKHLSFESRLVFFMPELDVVGPSR